MANGLSYYPSALRFDSNKSRIHPWRIKRRKCHWCIEKSAIRTAKSGLLGTLRKTLYVNDTLLSVYVDNTLPL